MNIYDIWLEKGYRVVATGTWLYDRTVPMRIEVWAKPACFAFARFDEDDQLIETRPIPETKDEFLYVLVPGSGEYMTIDEAKAAADAKPWGPVQMGLAELRAKIPHSGNPVSQDLAGCGRRPSKAAIESRPEGWAIMDKVKQHFEEEARDFDRIIATLIPDYPQMVEALVAAMPFESSAPVRVIDLGCGTATVAQGVLDAFPNAHVTCLDLAENMIAIAQSKLADYPRVHFTVGDFTTFGGEYDAVISSLALHHLATDEDKKHFYHRVYARLRPGGVFYNADVILASSDLLQAMYMRKWRAFMRRKISDEEIDGKWIPKYLAEDHPARLVDQLVWLTGIGFADVDVLWKRYNFAVYGGARY